MQILANSPFLRGLGGFLIAPLLDICNVELPIIEFSIRPNNNRLRTRHLLSKTQIDSAPGSMNSHFLYHGFHFAPPMAI